MSTFDSETVKPKAKRKRNKLVCAKVLQQLEFYFGDTNLHKDRFMKEKVLSSESPNGNPIPISTLMIFNKLKTIGATPEIIRKCVKTSSMLGLGEDGSSIVRVTPIKEPTNVDGRTVYVENLAPDSNHESLTEIFSRFGSVVYVSLPRFKRTKDIKGFAFIEFATVEGAKRACDGGEGGGVGVSGVDDVQKSDALLPEVKTPAPLPKMNRAMAALAKEKLKGDEGGGGATAKLEKEKTKKKQETAKDGFVSKPDDLELADSKISASSPSKRRRSVSEGEEEEQGGVKKAKRKRRGRIRSISVSVDGREEKGEELHVDGKEEGRSTVDGKPDERQSNLVKGQANGNPQKHSSIERNDAAVNGVEPAATSSDDPESGSKRDTTTTSAKEKKTLKRKKILTESDAAPIVEKKKKTKKKASLDKQLSEEERRKRKKEAMEKNVAAANAASNASDDSPGPKSASASANSSIPTCATATTISPGVDDDVKTEADQLDSAGEKSENPPEKKKPKNRRKKIDKKTKGKQLGLPSRPPTVMPKTEWLALRNEYLALQRQRMSALKQNLANSKTERNGHDETDGLGSDGRDCTTDGRVNSAATNGRTQSFETDPPVKREERTYDKVPGLIVKVQSETEDNPLPPRSLLKSSFEKELISPTDEAKGNVNIAYMDMEEGQLTGHIRCENAESASRVLELGLAGFGVFLLSGKDEDDYWEKVRLCREARKKSSNKKSHRPKNGLRKLVEKASVATAGDPAAAAATPSKTHVRFDDL